MSRPWFHTFRWSCWSYCRIFVNTQYAECACKVKHKRWTARVEKIKLSLSKLVYLFNEMSTEKGKAGSTQQPQYAGTLSPWKQHKDILFCFASFRILSKGMKGWKKKKKPKLKSTNEVNETLVCSERLLSDLWGSFQGEAGRDFYKTTTQVLPKEDIEMWLCCSREFLTSIFS